MSDYTERQKVKDIRFSGGINHDGFLYVPYKELVDGIKALPAIDVVKVRHGRWVKYTGMGKEQWMCSECSAEEKNPKVANYCYHCGAKMDGKKEG